jgi:hypothetical protein
LKSTVEADLIVVTIVDISEKTILLIDFRDFISYDAKDTSSNFKKVFNAIVIVRKKITYKYSFFLYSSEV